MGKLNCSVIRESNSLSVTKKSQQSSFKECSAFHTRHSPAHSCPRAPKRSVPRLRWVLWMRRSTRCNCEAQTQYWARTPISPTVGPTRLTGWTLHHHPQIRQTGYRYCPYLQLHLHLNQSFHLKLTDNSRTSVIRN